MRLTIGRKISIGMAIMIALVAIFALTANVSMFVLQKNTQAITTKSIPLVIACQEMNRYKTLARFQLRDYLTEDNPEKLVDIEKQFSESIANHDIYEKKIYDAIDDFPTGNQQLKDIWQKAMSTVMPDFNKAADRAIETHKKLLDVRAKRIALMDTHEDNGAKLYDHLVNYQRNNSDNETINISLMKLKNLHLQTILTDEEYITRGTLVGPKKRLAIRDDFRKHSDNFIEELEIIRTSADNNASIEFANKLSFLAVNFIFSATGKKQLFDTFDKELEYRQKEKELIAVIGKLADADSQMALTLTSLASAKLNKARLEADESAGKISKVLLVLCVLALIVSFMVTASISKQIVKPVLAISDAARAIAEGDLNQKVDISNDDEVGDLCKSFNQMSENLRSEVMVRKKAERERERLLEILEEKNRELQNVVYVASHDLRSPLVTINGFSEELGVLIQEIERILDSENIDENVKNKITPLLKEGIPEDLRFISAGAEKMQMLVSGLLQISRAGTAEVEMTTLDMNEMLKNICEAMQYEFSSKNISIEIRDLPKSYGDAAMINQVFSNLLDNAVKYGKNDGNNIITVSGWIESGNSVYCVEDNGIGITRKNLSKIFQVFHRLDPHGPVSGEGLGLTIISRILDRHKGKIWVESEPGQGSRFFVSLPSG